MSLIYVILLALEFACHPEESSADNSGVIKDDYGSTSLLPTDEAVKSPPEPPEPPV